MRKEKEIVKAFYDDFGWHKDTNGLYNDTATFVDLRPVLHSHDHKQRMRVKKFLKPSGLYFLDAGSGAIPHADYLEYSSGYRWRVCVDLSETALLEARPKLKEPGFCVLGDVTRLPFRSDVFDAVVSAHVLYHVPENEQEAAVLEFYRTLKPGGSCVIIYSSLRNPATFFVHLVKSSQSTARRVIGKIPGTSLVWRKVMRKGARSGREYQESSQGNKKTCPPLYFHAHDWRWFNSVFPDEWDIDIRCWNLLNYQFTSTFVPNNFWGRWLLKFIFWLETLFPHILVRVCCYPMIIIRK